MPLVLEGESFKEKLLEGVKEFTTLHGTCCSLLTSSECLRAGKYQMLHPHR